MLLFGPPGLGKTTLSHIIAAELGVNLRQTSGPVLEKPKDLESAFSSALAHQGPSLVEVLTDPNALSIPPEIKKDQVFGFATAMSRIVLNRGAGEAVSMARSNLRNIPRG